MSRGFTDFTGGNVTRRPKLDDVAADVGVSTASVSLVLRNAPGPSAETRARVLEAAQRLGYRPDRTASLLARRRSHLLGVLLDVRNPYHAELVAELHEAAENLGYDLVLSTVTASRHEDRAIETLTDFRCEALILLGPELSTSRLSSLGAQHPSIVVGRRTTAAHVDVVRSADDRGIAQAVEHLVEIGHRTIAFVDGGKGTIASDRRRGYRTSMRRHGLTDQIRVVPGDHTEASGARAAQEMLAVGLPSAVVTFNDRVALGLLDAFIRAGVDVPGDVSVIGYDDSPAARFAHIDLTSVSQDAAQQARHAVAAAVERLDGGHTGGHEVVLEPRLVIRGTTRRPT